MAYIFGSVVCGPWSVVRGLRSVDCLRRQLSQDTACKPGTARHQAVPQTMHLQTIDPNFKRAADR